MKILNPRDFKYDADWMDDKELYARQSKEIDFVYAEYDILTNKLEPGENFSKAINNRRFLERGDGKYQILFLHDYLPESMKKWHGGHYVFQGLMSDFMPLYSAFKPQIRVLDNW
jgi:hypothetical protein